jgi:nucleoside-triphosphatase THEP1
MEICYEDEEIIKTLCANKQIYRNILNWLRQFDYNTRISEKSCIIVSGQPCIGKTYSIEKICLHLNTDVTIIDNTKCYNSFQLKDIIFKTTTSSLVQILTNNARKKIIIIDNFDSMFVADKTINTTLLKLLTEKKLKNIPIICITNCDILKKMGDIKKICKVYELATPNKQDITDLLKPYDMSMNNIKILYDEYQGNLQMIFQNIDSIKELKSRQSQPCDTQFELINLYDMTFSRDKSRRLIDIDVWLVPLRFHENLIHELCNRGIPLHKKSCVYKDFMHILCIYDYFMCKNNIDCGIEIFIAAIYMVSILKYKKRHVSNMDNFTKILSYLSLQKKYVKASYNSTFPLYQISNYHISLTNRKFIYFN